MNRRQFLRAAAAAAASSNLLASAAVTAMPSTGIVFIFVDDLFSVEHYRTRFGVPIQTPHLDRLMKRGVTFLNAFCTTALCSPSRTSILTGRNPLKTGVNDNGQLWWTHVPAEWTLPAMLKQAGWHTYSYGKTFHGTGTGPRELMAPYFDEFYSVKYDDPESNGGDLVDVRHAVERIQALASEGTTPYFLMAGIEDPHLPFDARQRFTDLYPIDQIVIPEWSGDAPPSWVLPYLHRFKYREMKKDGTLDDFIQGYLANVSSMDWKLGKLMRAIDDSGLDPTIILASDHGFSLGDHDSVKKFTLWDEAGRAPLVIVRPGGQKNVKRNEVVSLIDIAPTVLDLAGLAKPADMDGRSLNKLVKDPLAERSGGVLTTMLGSFSLRTDLWRVTRYESGEQELFFIPDDPDNLDNLVDEPAHADDLAQMTARLDEAIAKWQPA